MTGLSAGIRCLEGGNEAGPSHRRQLQTRRPHQEGTARVEADNSSKVFAQREATIRSEAAANCQRAQNAKNRKAREEQEERQLAQKIDDITASPGFKLWGENRQRQCYKVSLIIQILKFILNASSI